ncbi:DEKNAAC102407 [Brettanomyces naardenensis]|uniref:DEKNAAC102407 n=1 Tax=Brettanomyces naardenensis TaxID=13370 RepID=A0A448YL81_BRENA|nr:DEKNAAC102407 [Brettanomyces naardenensis]
MSSDPSSSSFSLGELSKALSPLKTLVSTSSANTSDDPAGYWSSNSIFQFVNNVANSISNHRQSLDLINPGTMENLNKEVEKDVFLSQYEFTGLRADLSKTFSMNPMFQVSHSFSVGGKSPAYAFAGMFASGDSFMQGTIDNELSLTGRCNYAWDKNNISKVTLQLASGQQPMCQIEQDYQANDFSLNFKTLNPDFSGPAFKGVMVGSILQSITPKLALGMETAYSALQPGMPGDAAISLVGRYSGEKWVASAQLQAQGSLTAAYWRKVADNVEAGIETTLQASYQPVMNEMMMPTMQPVFEANTTIGAKYEFRQSIYRGQLSSDGQASFMLEHRILPTLGLTFTASMDQFKNTSKMGCGLQVETAGSEEVMMMQNGLLDADGNPVPGAPQMA